MSSPVEAGPVFSIPANTLPPRSAGPVDIAQAFPVLTAEQIDRIRPFGRIRQVQVGEILFEPGDLSVPFFVLLSGSLEIVQPSLQGESEIVTHHAGGFTGEMTMISRRGALARGRVTAAGDFLELGAEELQSLAARDADLSELFMRAFILRRLLLISYGQGNAILLGSRHSANTLHLREFLSRNGHPHTYIDLDVDQGAQDLLDRFSI
ncbi:MAG: cyclic nucleotide-binding domain-containing protein, partial [Candidatus Sulfotelmatobacter sp.]